MSVRPSALTYYLTPLFFYLNNHMLCDLLNIQKGITSVIGGGGKTTLIHFLASELIERGTVIITTTTHIMKSDVFPNVLTQDDADNLSMITKHISQRRCLCVGSVYDGDKLSAPCVELTDLLSVCDYVLVEADGSKHLPLKAHSDREPVIPQESNRTILVLGVDAVGKKLKDVTHREHIACEILGCSGRDTVTADMVAQLANTENLHDVAVINKCDTTELVDTANSIAKKLKSKCIISSLLKGEMYVSSN